MVSATFELPVENTPRGVRLPVSWAFDLEQTLECGQAFRWERQPDGAYTGVAGKRFCRISQDETSIFLEGASPDDFERFWRGYFDLDRDYGAIRSALCQDPVMEKAVRHAPGIRVLRQEPWEALCSFLISQNNNIPRIKGIIARLCRGWGADLGGVYAFPEPETLARLAPEDLSPLQAGYRARYLVGAAREVASGAVDLEALKTLPLEEARASLRRITGVGPKVAECALLYGCGRVECFPVDVWIARAMKTLFPDGLPECAKPWAGIAQQYLFHYMRRGPGKTQEN